MVPPRTLTMKMYCYFGPVIIPCTDGQVPRTVPGPGRAADRGGCGGVVEAAVQAGQAAVRVPRGQAHRRHGAQQGGEVQGAGAGALRDL